MLAFIRKLVGEVVLYFKFGEEQFPINPFCRLIIVVESYDGTELQPAWWGREIFLDEAREVARENRPSEFFLQKFNRFGRWAGRYALP
jgi:hypothetical protein